MDRAKWILRTSIFLSGLSLITISGIGASVPEKIKDGLTFYAPFDGTTKAEISGGNPKAIMPGEWEFEESKIGQGLKVGKGSPAVSYSCDGNFLADKGTLAFWAKLWWAPNTPRENVDKRPTFFTTGDGVILIHWWAGSKELFFSTLSKEWAWNPQVNIAWMKSDKWHHYVFTWTKFKKRIYIDGDSQAESEHVERVLNPFVPGSSFTVGYTNPNSSWVEPDATFDELLIWNRCLSPEEISELYKSYK